MNIEHEKGGLRVNGGRLSYTEFFVFNVRQRADGCIFSYRLKPLGV